MKKKIIVLGLGNFGGNLALKLTEDGHEVFGVDSNPSRVDMIQNKINHALGLDASDESCINYLPIDDCDLVVIAIGENIGASVTTTALIKKHYNGRIIVRSLSTLHKLIYISEKSEADISPSTKDLAKSKRVALIVEFHFLYNFQIVAY